MQRGAGTEMVRRALVISALFRLFQPFGAGSTAFLNF